MSFEVKIEGADAILKKMEAVKHEAIYKGGRSSLRRAAKVIADAAKLNAQKLNDPATANDISKNIDFRWNGRIYKRTGDLAFRVGVRGGAVDYSNTADNRRAGRVGKQFKTDGSKANPGGDTWYWRLLEFGTSKMGARPFMRPAAEQNTFAVINTFATNFEKSLDRAIKKGQTR